MTLKGINQKRKDIHWTKLKIRSFFKKIKIPKASEQVPNQRRYSQYILPTEHKNKKYVIKTCKE